MAEEKLCYEDCFNYSSNYGGCDYSGWLDVEPIEPGQRCIHPEFSEDELILVKKTNLLSLISLADLLSSPQNSLEKDYQ